MSDLFERVCCLYMWSQKVVVETRRLKRRDSETRDTERRVERSEIHAR